MEDRHDSHGKGVQWGGVVIDAERGLAIQIWTMHDVNSALVASSARVVNVDIQAPRTVRDGLVVAFRAGWDGIHVP